MCLASKEVLDGAEDQEQTGSQVSQIVQYIELPAQVD
jgi:hypothetical protein